MTAEMHLNHHQKWPRSRIISGTKTSGEDRSRPHRVSPEEMEEFSAIIREQFGMDPAAVLQKAYEEKYGSGYDELWPDEIEDPWGLKKIRVSLSRSVLSNAQWERIAPEL